MPPLIILPGIGGSDASHWQTLWERQCSLATRFKPASWDAPDLEDWLHALETAVKSAPTAPVLIAHSLSCLLIAHWSARSNLAISGAFMVAVPDPSSIAFPVEAAQFTSTPREPLRFPAVVIASENDPYGSADYQRRMACDWGAKLTLVGALGHIKGSSEIDEWPDGRVVLKAFVETLEGPA